MSDLSPKTKTYICIHSHYEAISNLFERLEGNCKVILD